MQFQVCESDDSCQPGAQYTNPRVVVQEHHGAPLLNCSGLVLVRQLIERLGVASAIDAGLYGCCNAASGTGNRIIS